MIKGVIFDFDGVIADSLPIILKYLPEIAKENGYTDLQKKVEKKHNVKINNIKKMKKIFRDETAKDFLNDLKKFNISRTKFLILLNSLRNKLHSDVSKVKVFPGIKQTLRNISKKYKTGMISSSKEKFISDFFKKNKLTKLKYAITGVSLFGKTVRINKMVKQMNLKKKEVIFITDETRDIESCKKAGIKSIAVTWGFESKKLLKKGSKKVII